MDTRESDDEREQPLIDAARRQARREADIATTPAGTAPCGPESAARTSPLAADSIPGYEIVRELHRGGQGVVYQALQKSTKRKVAVKVMREGPFAGPADRARFEHEVQILGQLKHPNIVAIHDSGEAAGQFFYVMDYIPGQALDAYMAAEQRTIIETLRLFSKICAAVNAAHLRGVIHRDLKPGNIRVDPDGEPHILDFGLAKTIGDGGRADVMTMTGQFVGSLPWASPEQAGGVPGQIDVRTDVYSLGVILYQMLTQRFPYEVTGNMRDVLDRIIKTAPARPSTLRRQINDEVETIVLKCLAKERERRYQSAGELGRDVGRYLAGEPIEAKRDSFAYVLRKQLRRYKLPAAVAVAFIVVVTVGFVTSLTFWRQSVADRERAEDSLAVTMAVNAFLAEMLATADPAIARGREITVVQVVDAAATRVDEGSLAAQPRVEAEVRRTIGGAYHGLGRYAAAERHLRKALDLLRRLFDQPHESVADTLHRLADVLRLQRVPGKTKEAEALLRDALAVDRAVYGDEHQNVATANHNLAAVLHGQQRLDEAEPLYLEALRIQRASGGDASQVADILNGLAQCLADQDKVDEAEARQREALALYVQVRDGDHLDVLLCQINLAHLLILKERYAEAEDLLLRPLEVYRRILPAGHPGLTRPLILLGLALLRQARATEAEPLLRECLEIRQAGLPDGHWLVGNTQSVLGECLAAQQRFAEAEALLLDAYQMMIGRPEDAAPLPRQRETLQRIVRLYEGWGNAEEAEKWRQKLRGAR